MLQRLSLYVLSYSGNTAVYSSAELEGDTDNEHFVYLIISSNKDIHVERSR